MGVFGDLAFHHVADGNDADQTIRLHDRQMPDAPIGHAGHQGRHLLGRFGIDHLGRHIVGDRTSQRIGAIGPAPGTPKEEEIAAARVLLIDHYGGEANLRAVQIARRHGSSDLLFAIPHDLDARGHVFEPNEDGARGKPDHSC